MEECGYRAIAVANVDAALTIVDNLEPARAVLLDLNLPGTSGFALADILRRTPSWTKVPVFITSGSVTEVPPGVTGILPKPYDVESLLDTMRRATERNAALH